MDSGFRPRLCDFANANAAATTASFSRSGTYVLRLAASDGVLSAFDEVTLTVGTTAVSPVSGLVGHWRFDEGSGTTAGDSSGNDNTGTLTDMDALNAWATVKLGTGVDFSGPSDHVSIPNSPELQLSSEFTLSAWINPGIDSGTDKRIINKQRRSTRTTYGLFYDPKEGVSLRTEDCSGSIGTSPYMGEVPVDQWSHVAATFESSATIGFIYINGEKIGSSTTLRTPCHTDSGDLNIGGHPGHKQDRWLKGIIDDVRIYNRALAPEEVAALAAPDAASQPPVVDAGPDQTVTLPDSASLQGTVTDDGLPDPPGELTLSWTQVSGPGSVTFADANAAATTASFSRSGTYVLRLTADDGALSAFDEAAVSVGIVYGDANLDSQFNAEDTYLLVDWLIGAAPMPEPGTPAFVAADVDGDGQVTVADIDLMVKKLKGEIEKFPVEP